MDHSENNKRIAKNTFMLYIRMFLTMGVSLFTSRVILQALGVEDYGVYSVVAGIITMFSFINGGMISATQRYITFEIGKGNMLRLKKVFSTSLQIHALIALIIILLGETVGLWFLYEKLVLPAERMTAALWVYQCSIVACVVNIMSVPYNADIIAHEKMTVFAYVSVLEVMLKLAIVYMLYITPWDKLISYAILILCVQLIIRYVYAHYCHKHFEESHYHHQIDKSLFKEMFSFSGWSFWGNLAGVLYTQGVNIILNMFFGAIVNAARGIAVQVQTTIYQFVHNIQVAINPQITKNYATGNLVQMHSLMFRSARFSFFLLFMITLPVLIETDYILKVWLKTPPPDTIVFLRWMIGISLLHTISNPCVIANQATGKVKVYQAVVGGILLLILPVSYIALRLGAPAYSVFIVHFCIESLAQIARMYMLRKLIKLPLYAYIRNIYIPVIAVATVSCILPIYMYTHISEGFIGLLFLTAISVFSVATTAFLIGLTKEERRFIILKVKQIINRDNDTYYK